MKVSIGKILCNLAVVGFFVACTDPVPNLPPSELPVVLIEASVSDSQLDREGTDCIFSVTDKEMRYIQSVSEGTVHLRGNTTAVCPKKPFDVRLNKSQRVLNMPPAHRWVLLANYFDRTMLRNALAFIISEDSRLDWTPRFQFVDLYYNGVPRGTYQLCEKVQVRANRVPVPHDGWLVEIDAHATKQDTRFYVAHLESPVRVDRLPEDDPSALDSLKALFKNADKALFANTFCDSLIGWRKYLDEASFVDWYVINEIAKNNDACMYSSCFMHSGSDGKIVMGPVWDFDLAFGNITSHECDSPEGFYIRNARWYKRLMQDSTFEKRVNERFAYFLSREQKYSDFIRKAAERLAPYAQTNENIWQTLGVPIEPGLKAYDTYEEEVAALDEWLHARCLWLSRQYTHASP